MLYLLGSQGSDSCHISFRKTVFRVCYLIFNVYFDDPKQWIKRSLVNFICEAKTLSKQDVLIMSTCITGSKGVLAMRPIPVQFLSFSCSFERKFCQVIDWRSSGSSGRVRGGRETWNLCGRLRLPSFLWPIFTGPGGAMAPSAPPLDPLLWRPSWGWWCVCAVNRNYAFQVG